ncbi:MAG TPA: bifunctional DNA primase/polymerase [Propionicimonas sp.]|jgi:hypothetical protein
MSPDDDGGPDSLGQRPGHHETGVGAFGLGTCSNESRVAGAADGPRPPHPDIEDETISDEFADDLEIPHWLVDAGIPVLVAKPAIDRRGNHDWAAGVGGFFPPAGWPTARPSHAEVDRWRPGFGLLAVTGCGLDVLDVDPRNGGGATIAMLREAGLVPRIVGEVETPSGGSHLFVRSLGVGTARIDGVDIQAGDRAGAGRAFVWTTPTRRRAKAGPRAGDVVAYRWVVEPAEADLATLGGDEPDDGADLLRELIASRHRDPRTFDGDAPQTVYTQEPPPWRQLVDRYLARRVEAMREAYAAYATWPVGRRTTSGFGWERLVANAAFELGGLARASWTPWSLEDARRVFEDVVPQRMRRDPGVGPKWASQALRGAPAPLPAHLRPGVVS